MGFVYCLVQYLSLLTCKSSVQFVLWTVQKTVTQASVLERVAAVKLSKHIFFKAVWNKK